MQKKQAKPNNEEMPDIWATLEKRGVPIERHQVTQHVIKQNGSHYYEVEDMNERTIVCTRCPVRHGLTIKPTELADYNLIDGVLFYKGEQQNQT